MSRHVQNEYDMHNTYMIMEAEKMNELNNNIIWLIGKITDDVANQFIRDFMYIHRKNVEKKPIHIYITSIGGSVDAGLMLYELIRQSPYEIHTYAIGKVYSIAAIIYLAGDKRYMSVHGTIMIHSPLIKGTLYANQYELKEMTNSLNTKQKRLEEIIISRTGIKKEAIESMMFTDTYYTFYKALEANIAHDFYRL